jgi:hypothetical protein
MRESTRTEWPGPGKCEARCRDLFRKGGVSCSSFSVLIHFGKYRGFGNFFGQRSPHCNHRVDFGEWLSLVEHLVRDQGVGGSNPLSPTNYFQADAAFFKIAKNPTVVDFVAVQASVNHKKEIVREFSEDQVESAA